MIHTAEADRELVAMIQAHVEHGRLDLVHRAIGRVRDETAALIKVDEMPEAQRRMLLASEPVDRDGKEGIVVELRTGADVNVAKALERRGLGTREDGLDGMPGMYWSNAEGLALRQFLKESAK